MEIIVKVSFAVNVELHERMDNVMKYCEDCGTQLEDDATFCTNCGAKQEIVFIPEVESPVNQLNENQDRILIIEQEPKLKEIKLSDVCTPEKREIKSWLNILVR